MQVMYNAILKKILHQEYTFTFIDDKLTLFDKDKNIILYSNYLPNIKQFREYKGIASDLLTEEQCSELMKLCYVINKHGLDTIKKILI